MSWGWHCADDHQENRWIFSAGDVDNLIKLPGVWPCWDQFRTTASILGEPTLFGDPDGSGAWESFLEVHWNHRLFIVNEYGQLFPMVAEDKRHAKDAITCECRGKPRATIHAHGETG